MAIEHTFKTTRNREKTKVLTPIKSIREHCVLCNNGQRGIRECGGGKCPLYPFRMGDAHAVSVEQRKRLSEANRAALR
jgi:hypothetical protein